MSYQVLARKWRPRNFSTLVGQEHVVRALTHALEAGRLHHAYLFTGTRGVGKTTLARILAKSLNCETGLTATPCGACAACQEIDAGRFVDLLEVDAATNTRVDEMRQLLENAVYAPTRGRFKVYVIDEVHMLSNSAFNAMLKTLEEPPAHVKFILATTDPQKIPVTVLSRCLQFNLKQMSDLAIVGHLAHILQAEGLAHDRAALSLIARSAGGSMRDALSLLDQAIAHGAGAVEEPQVRAMLGAVGGEYVFSLLDAIVSGDAAEVLRLASELASRSVSLVLTLQELAAQLIRLQVAQMAPATLEDDDPDAATLRGLAARFSPEFIQLAYQVLIHGKQELPLAPDEYGGFVMTLLRLLAFRPETVGDVVEAAAASHRARSAMPAPPIERAAPLAAPQRASAVPVVAVQPASSVPAAPAVEDAPQLVPDPVPAPRIGETPSWRELLTAMNLGGMAKALAQQCELRRLTQDACFLRLPSNQAHLQMKASVDKLQQCLNDYFGRAVALRIELGETESETPAVAVDRERRQAQGEAEAAVENDPFVRDMVDLFDATVVGASIKPIN